MPSDGATDSHNRSAGSHDDINFGRNGPPAGRGGHGGHFLRAGLWHLPGRISSPTATHSCYSPSAHILFNNAEFGRIDERSKLTRSRPRRPAAVGTIGKA